MAELMLSEDEQGGAGALVAAGQVGRRRWRSGAGIVLGCADGKTNQQVAAELDLAASRGQVAGTVDPAAAGWAAMVEGPAARRRSP